MSFNAQERCLNTTDLLGDEIKTSKDTVVIFRILDDKIVSECYNLEELRNTFESNHIAEIFDANSVIFKLPWSSIRIDYYTAALIIVCRLNTIILSNTAVTKKYKKDDIHIHYGAPIHRKTYTDGNIKNINKIFNLFLDGKFVPEKLDKISSKLLSNLKPILVYGQILFSGSAFDARNIISIIDGSTALPPIYMDVEKLWGLVKDEYKKDKFFTDVTVGDGVIVSNRGLNRIFIKRYNSIENKNFIGNLYYWDIDVNTVYVRGGMVDEDLLKKITEDKESQKIIKILTKYNKWTTPA